MERNRTAAEHAAAASQSAGRDRRGAPGSDEAGDGPAAGQRSAPTGSTATGAESCNTAPANRHCPRVSEDGHRLETGGFDTLSLSLYGRFNEESFPALCGQLQLAQQAAQKGDLHDSLIVLPDGETALVGTKGRGRSRGFARWTFQCQGIDFAVAEREDCGSPQDRQRQPNMYAELRSMPLLQFGLVESLAVMQRVLLSLGYELEKACPSRVDGCVDLLDVSMREFERAFEERRFVCRARKWKKYGEDGELQTLCLGASGAPTFVRLYDKLEECRSNPTKHALLVAHRWGHEPHPVRGATRVEFQLRRDALREDHSINDVVDLMAKSRSLFDYLTHEWLRVVDQPVSTGHSERQGPSALWQKVIDAFQQWTGSPLEPRSRRVALPPDENVLVRQALGCLTKAAAARGITEKDQLLEYWQGHFADLERLQFDVLLKRLALDASLPV